MFVYNRYMGGDRPSDVCWQRSSDSPQYHNLSTYTAYEQLYSPNQATRQTETDYIHTEDKSTIKSYIITIRTHC